MPVKNVNSDDIARLLISITKVGKPRVNFTARSGGGGGSTGGGGGGSSSDGGLFPSVMTDYGDMIYAGFWGGPRRLGPVGTVGQVLTVVDDGDGLRPDWMDATGGGGPSGEKYRQYIVDSNPAGEGFIIMDAGLGIPMYELVDLE